MDNGESSYRRFLAGDNEGMLEIVCEYPAYLDGVVYKPQTEDVPYEDIQVWY